MHLYLQSTDAPIASFDIAAVDRVNQDAVLTLFQGFNSEYSSENKAFIAAVLAKSLDGVRVVNYVQWDDARGYEDYINNASRRTFETKATNLCTLDTHLYNLTLTHPLVSRAEITVDMLEYFNFGIFKMAPENHEKVLEVFKHILNTKFQFAEGLISTYLHQSVDKTRLVNFGVWRSPEDFQKSAKPMDNSKYEDQTFDVPFDNEFQPSLYKPVQVVQQEATE